MNLKLKFSYDGQAAMLYKHAVWLFLLGGMHMSFGRSNIGILNIRNGGEKG